MPVSIPDSAFDADYQMFMRTAKEARTLLFDLKQKYRTFPWKDFIVANSNRRPTFHAYHIHNWFDQCIRAQERLLKELSLFLEIEFSLLFPSTALSPQAIVYSRFLDNYPALFKMILDPVCV